MLQQPNQAPEPEDLDYETTEPKEQESVTLRNASEITGGKLFFGEDLISALESLNTDRIQVDTKSLLQLMKLCNLEQISIVLDDDPESQEFKIQANPEEKKVTGKNGKASYSLTIKVGKDLIPELQTSSNLELFILELESTLKNSIISSSMEFNKFRESIPDLINMSREVYDKNTTAVLMFTVPSIIILATMFAKMPPEYIPGIILIALPVFLGYNLQLLENTDGLYSKYISALPQMIKREIALLKQKTGMSKSFISTKERDDFSHLEG